MTPNRRKRASKKRLSGEEISCPVPPNSNEVKQKLNEMVDNGTLSLGLPCVPYTLSKHVVKAEEQIAFIPDQCECLEEMKEILHSSNGVPIKVFLDFLLVITLHKILKEARKMMGTTNAVDVG